MRSADFGFAWPLTTMGFEPIAIVGRSCLLPGALGPDALWRAIAEGRSLVGGPPEGAERFDPRDAGAGTEQAVATAAARRIGGHVTGFEGVFDPSGFAVDADQIMALDPLFQWTLHCGREAWRDAGGEGVLGRGRTAVVLANLSYPTRSLVELAGATWLDAQPWTPRSGRSLTLENRFLSGYPAHLLARALRLDGPAFALDAACASSLCALESACAMLQERSVDAAIVAAVNHSDNLFLHLGFSALNALSPSGQSRPFHRSADGLLPTEGAAAIVVKRAGDVDPDQERVLGVVRGVGLTNDGVRRGLLSPDPDGQRDAIVRAYERARIDPAGVSLIECHATGTPTGDPIEARNLRDVFAAAEDLPIGSIKSNLGHPITVAGLAGVLKVLGAFEHGVRPAMPAADDPIAEANEGPLRLLAQNEEWSGGAPRRAGVSAFGFGGNNAHVILEEWTPSPARPPRRSIAAPVPDIAVCGVGLRLGGAEGVEAVLAHLAKRPGEAVDTRMGDLIVDLARARTTPADLQCTLAQQTALFDVVDEALATAVEPAAERVGVFVGMGCDAEAARWGFRWRLGDAATERLGRAPDAEWLAHARDAVVTPIDAASVLGAMPNVPANRLSVRHDWRGPGYTLSSEELSGLHALEAAARALRAGEIDMAVVAAVDLSDEPVHAAAAAAVLPAARRAPGDGVAALVLKRAETAERDADKVFVHLLSDPPEDDGVSEDGAEPTPLSARFGHAHAASGLARLAMEIAARSRRIAPGVAASAPWFPHTPTPRHALSVTSFSGQRAQAHLTFSQPPEPSARLAAPLRPYWWAAPDRAGLAARVAEDVMGGEGPCRLAIVAPSAEIAEARRRGALEQLGAGKEPSGPGVSFHAAPMGGETAVMFTGSAAAYPGMARELFAAFPEICDRVGARFATADAIAQALAAAPDLRADPFLQLRASTLVCQAHAALAMGLLAIAPTAALGLSSGETNALLAFGVWEDGDALLEEVEASGMFSAHLAGRFMAAATAWGERLEAVDWCNWRLLAPVEEVRAACAAEPRADISIISGGADCVIGGDGAACRRVIDQVGRDRAVDLGQNLIVHCAELAPFAESWRRLHTRPTRAIPDVRFYTNATNAAYDVSDATVADALTTQAANPIDFPATVEQAWRDGVRVFVECGPRDALTRSVQETLAGRDHLAVSFDRFDRGDFGQIVDAAAQLYAAGLDIDLALLAERAAAIDEASHAKAPPAGRTVTLPAHPPAIALPPPPKDKNAADTMPAAPSLPSAQWTAAEMASAQERAPEHPSVMALAPGMKPSPSAAPRRAPTPVSRPQPPTAPKRPPHKTPVRARPPLVVAPERPPVGPAFSSKALVGAASGPVSALFGEMFQRQDGFRRQVRMPMPPLLLVDRVTGVEGPPGVQGKGTIWTETDVVHDAWYLHDGRMSPGVVIESGQADLLLISWMGADFLNKDERVYRLLGCELTFHGGGLPAVGDTLRFQISIDGHAQHGDVRLFFFHYDCRIGDRPLISVRNGQAGFFTDAELASSGGVLWDAAKDGPPTAEPRLASIPRASAKRAFTAEDVAAFVAGDAFTCFGAGFERTGPHHRTPRPPAGRLQLIDEVSAFEPAGGPWGRGYLRAEAAAPANAWFYNGHFHNDPCMPGTLMADAATQALGFFMAASGLTLDRDGWRFEPAEDEAFKFVCRGQVIPDGAHRVSYEVFVDEIVDGPEPTVFASLLATSDGLKVFHCPRFGLKLVRDWPMGREADAELARVVSPTGDVRGDRGALLACGNGRPSDAFGAMYARFDRESRIPRLPTPPYHFVSRIVSVSAPPGEPAENAEVIAEYDPPTDAWFFAERGGGAMPFAVLAEVMLQPCGWLASYAGFALAGDLAFRNLDGDDMLISQEIRPGDGPVRVAAQLTRWSAVGPMTLVFFDVTCTVGADTVATVRTSFGFFPEAALAQQKGLAFSPMRRAARTIDSDVHVTLPACADGAGARLRLVDEITGFWPRGGDAGLGLIRGRQTVDPRAWYFRAHFYEDPVQAGSLGLEALYQLMEEGLARIGVLDRVRDPIVELPALGRAFTWRYRGQVTPEAGEVTTVVEFSGIEEEAGGMLVTADGALWVDDTPIYELRGMTARVRAGGF